MSTLVVATRNAKKAEELKVLLAPGGLRLLTLADFPEAPEVSEDGEIFEANAERKATQIAVALGQWVLGEDSGLVVPALGGRPGVRSARFAGEKASDEENNRKLLQELEGVPEAKRGAYYVCCLVLADLSGVVRARAEGRCHGRITTEPRGSGGFGYDPLFLLAEYHKTFGELSPRLKRYLSHRARAVGRLLPELMAMKHRGELGA